VESAGFAGDADLRSVDRDDGVRRVVADRRPRDRPSGVQVLARTTLDRVDAVFEFAARFWVETDVSIDPPIAATLSHVAWTFESGLTIFVIVQ
jgi:hypothetical protein